MWKDAGDRGTVPEHSPPGGAALGKVELGQSYQSALLYRLYFWGLHAGVEPYLMVVVCFCSDACMQVREPWKLRRPNDLSM